MKLMITAMNTSFVPLDSAFCSVIRDFDKPADGSYTSFRMSFFLVTGIQMIL